MCLDFCSTIFELRSDAREGMVMLVGVVLDGIGVDEVASPTSTDRVGRVGRGGPVSETI